MTRGTTAERHGDLDCHGRRGRPAAAEPGRFRFHFDSDGHGQDIVVLHGRVVVDDDHPVIQDWPSYLEKYGPAVERVFGSIAKFSESYPIALRITITGVRGFYVRGRERLTVVATR
jgi:hypothetical protein